MATKPIAPIEVTRIAEVEGVHSNGKDAVGDLDDEVVVGVHQAEPEACPADLDRRTSEMSQEASPVEIVTEERGRRPHAVCVDVEQAC